MVSTQGPRVPGAEVGCDFAEGPESEIRGRSRAGPRLFTASNRVSLRGTMAKAKKSLPTADGVYNRWSEHEQMYNEWNKFSKAKFSKAQKDALAWIQITGRKPKTRDTRTVQILEEREAFERDTKTDRYRATKPWLLRSHPQFAAYNQLKREGWEYLPYFLEDFHSDESDIEFDIPMLRDPEACVICQDGRILLTTDRRGKSIPRERQGPIEIEECKSQRLIYPRTKAEKIGEEIFQDLRKALDALVETRELVIAAGPTQNWAITDKSDKWAAKRQHLRRVAKLEDIIDELRQLADFSIEGLSEYKKARLWRGK